MSKLWQWQIVKPFVQFLDAAQNLLKNVANVIPHYAKVVPIFLPFNMDITLSSYIMHAPVSPIHFRITWQWLLTGHLLLNLYQAKFSQKLHGATISLIAARSHKKSAKAMVFNMSVPLEVHICEVFSLLLPVHIQRYIAMVIDWTPPTILIPYQVQPGPAQEPWPLSSRQKVQGSTRCCWKDVYISLSSRVLNRASSHRCGNWYLAMFLFRDGLFTLTNIVSFIVLSEVLCFSSFYAKTVYSSMLVCDFRMFLKLKKGFEVFFISFSKCPCRFTSILLITQSCVTLIPLNHSTFLCVCGFVLGAIRRFLMVLPPLKLLVSHVCCNNS